MSIPSVLQYAHVLLSGSLSPGDVAIDATVGNGHDTVFLADCVGPGGRVFGFDVQADAIQSTAQKFSDGPSAEAVTLIQEGHERMDRYIPEVLHGAVGAVAFNLGYLPGSDHGVITQPKTTLTALAKACSMIREKGVITAVLYTGHDGGRAEADAVVEWATDLPSQEYHAVSYRPRNRAEPPRLIAIERRAAP